MNCIYRLVWNYSSGLLVAVSENAKGRGKSGSPRKLIAGALALAGSAWLAPVFAGPTGGQVSAGAGTIAQAGSTTTINQSSQNLAINWQGFNVAPNEAVRFNQPNAASIALNRVIGQSPSQIMGSLRANGQVFVLNPNGVLFGASAQVNVGGLVASTLGLSDTAFMAGNYSFTGTSTAGSVVNQGSLTATQGGYIALLAPEVRNEGVIVASRGTALLAAGDKVTLNLNNGSLLGYSIDQGALNALADNKQLIQADGGQVFMSAKAADALSSAVVNNTGIIQARTIQNVGGVIKLMGDMETGTVNVGGTLDASAPTGGNGGFIETSAAHVKVADGARISTQAENGLSGTWLVDPTDFTISAGTSVQTTSGMGASTLATALGTGNVSIATSATANGSDLGDINVNAAVAWNANKLTLTAHNNININANLNASATASLALEFGQGSVAAGNTGNVITKNGAAVNLPASTTNFTTKQGSDGVLKAYTVITALGVEGDATTAPTTGTLQGMAAVANLSNNYVLGANIEACLTGGNCTSGATTAWNAGAGFAKINDFAGTFDGLGHTISNLTTNQTGANSIGLFGLSSSTSVIRNVGLVGGSVAGGTGNYVGGLVGYNQGTISNSYATGGVSSGSGYYVGGLVGYNTGTISNSYATGGVSSGSGSSVGGLVGSNHGPVNNSYATGSVTGGSYVGGLVGGNSAGINNSYAAGLVSGAGISVGGLVGYNQSTISNSFWDTVTSGQATSAGGTGLTTAQMKQMSSFSSWGTAITDTGGSSTAVWRIYEGQSAPLLRSFLAPITLTPAYDGSATTGIAGYTANIASPVTANLLATQAGLTLSSTATAGTQTAILSNFSSNQQGYDISYASRTITGTGSAADDLNIANPLSWSAGKLTLNAQNSININANLNASATASLALEFGQGSVAVGNTGNVITKNGAAVNLPASTTNFTTKQGSNGVVKNYTVITALGVEGDATTAPTTGTLQGMAAVANLSNNYVLGANIEACVTGGNCTSGATPAWNAGAGFAKINDFAGTFDGLGHTISNLTINQTGANFIGLFGVSYSTSVIRNVGLVGGSVAGGTGNNVGGLVGSANGATISNSYTTGNVSSTTGNNVGGLVGSADRATISNSYTTGNVSSTSGLYVGGLAGRNAGTISNSYATGTVSSTSGGWVGGLVGVNIGGTISNSYAAGSVTGTSHVGGLVGYNQSTISNSFWDTVTSGQATSAGGTGLTTAQMKQMSSFSSWGANITDTGGSSTAVWRIYEGQSAPLLRSFLTPITLTPVYNGTAQTLASIADYTASVASPVTANLIATQAGLTLSSTATAGTQTATLNNFSSNQQGYDISYASRTITGTGSAADDLSIANPLSWSAGKLTLNAQNSIQLNANLNASATASLALEFGQGSVAVGNTGNVITKNGAAVNLPASTTNFSTRQGSDGAVNAYTVITTLGAAADATTAPATATLQGMAASANLATNYVLGANIDAAPTSNWNSNGATTPTYAGFTPIVGVDIAFTGTFDGLGHTITGLTIDRPTTNNVGFFGDARSVIRNVGLLGGRVSGSGSVYVGGLVGFAYGATISNSYTTGNVNGSDHVGGLVGWSDSATTISNSHATGTVSGNIHVGGLVGYSGGMISNSYATGNVTGGLYIGTGGLVGVSATMVSDSYATGTVSGTQAVGGLIGRNLGAIRNSYATGNITASESWSGGLVGYNEPATSFLTISESYATGNVSSTSSEVGGLLGFNAGTVRKSYASGNVSGTTNIGGLVGTLFQTNGTISNSYATGSVTGTTTRVGGLVGLVMLGGLIESSYATGLVTGPTYTGGLVGRIASGGTVNDSFWDTVTTGQVTSAGGGTGLITVQMQQMSSFSSWATGITDTGGSSTAVWRIYEGHTSPLLRSFMTPLTLADAADATVTYNGATQNGAATANSSVLGAAATGRNAGLYNGYYSIQQGYDITGGNLTITAKALTASGLTVAASKVYDGTTGAAVIGTAALLAAEASGAGTTADGKAYTGDTVSITGTATGTYNSKDVAAANAVTFGGLTLAGTQAGNYTLTAQGNAAATITAKALTASALTVAASKIYDGATTATVSGTAALLAAEAVGAGTTADGKAYTGDAVALSGTATGTYNSKDVAAANAVTFGGLTLAGAQAGNYTIQTAAATITAKALTASGLTAAANKIYDGATAATVSGTAALLTAEASGTGTTADGKAYTGDAVALSGTATGTYNSKDVAAANAVTFGGLTLAGTQAGNYTLTAQGNAAATITA
ncbi:MAG: filamentous hemagglutinin N-terminal domain-containing protein, partial [Glaciimonas sp.]|nr:filamentous hemagglutinin N-terminal domain-containing protein [Glaciimonas sp.]